MVSKETFCRVLEAYKNLEDIFHDMIDKNYMPTKNPIADSAFEMLDAVVQEIEVGYDEELGPLTYIYMFECQFGKYDYERQIWAEVDGKMQVVDKGQCLIVINGEKKRPTTFEELYDLLMEVYHKN